VGWVVVVQKDNSKLQIYQKLIPNQDFKKKIKKKIKKKKNILQVVM
jgi:hypothetical protein